MSLIELFLLAVGLSMDAFAIAVCSGLTMKKFIVKDAVVIGLYFGVSQAVMPLVGYMAATLFAEQIISFDHWVAFALLCFLGVRMVIGSFRDKSSDDSVRASIKPAYMLPLAIATSIDALAVGISFAFLRVKIVPAASFIGVTTLILSIGGVKIGNAFGARFKSKAELAGGVILVAIGLKILIEHLVSWL